MAGDCDADHGRPASLKTQTQTEARLLPLCSLSCIDEMLVTCSRVAPARKAAFKAAASLPGTASGTRRALVGLSALPFQSRMQGGTAAFACGPFDAGRAVRRLSILDTLHGEVSEADDEVLSVVSVPGFHRTGRAASNLLSLPFQSTGTAPRASWFLSYSSPQLTLFISSPRPHTPTHPHAPFSSLSQPYPSLASQTPRRLSIPSGRHSRYTRNTNHPLQTAA